MYTQCPDCGTAFRVTADVLKQAAGEVRCGGCDKAFNALEYLSESVPEEATPTETGQGLPELAAEDDDGARQPISAAQSATLLKTFDELAGSDIRIEDTGVEWRVMEEHEIGAAADDDIAVDVPVEDQPGIDDAEQALKNADAGFETIIMEGEHVRSALQEDHREAGREAAAAGLAAAAGRADAQAVDDGRRNAGLIAAAVMLVLVLAGQAVHRSRDALATIPAFNDIVGPVYRAFGRPLSPEWDITGWRFEVTKGRTDEAGGNLTIYARLGNTSDTALPYPLIGISLTDRFEETIGSRVLDPAEYLAGDPDPRELVAAGDTFDAVMTIPSPSYEAAGFRLKVCYRGSGGKLRCAVDDFK